MTAKLLLAISPVVQGLLSTGKTFYITTGIFCILILLLTLYITIFSKPVTKTSRHLKGMILTALWTCVSVMVLVVLSSWQGLPLLGYPKFFWGVLGLLVIWLNGIWIYQLTIVPKKQIHEQRLTTYLAYLPKYRKINS